MNYEKEINDLKRQVKQLNESVLAMGKNNVGQVSKLDDTSNKVEELTPYTDTKTAYYGDYECMFYDVPQGNVSVFFDNYTGAYMPDRKEDRLNVIFADNIRADRTQVTIVVQ